MNKKILTIAIICFSCLLLITSFAVADKPEWAGKPEWDEREQIEQEAKKAGQEVERGENKESELARSDRCTGSCLRRGYRFRMIHEYVLAQRASDFFVDGAFTGDIKHPDSTVGLLTFNHPPYSHIRLELSVRQLMEVLGYDDVSRFDKFMGRRVEDAFDPEFTLFRDTCAEGCKCNDRYWEYLETEFAGWSKKLALSFSHPKYEVLNIKLTVDIAYETILQKTGCKE